MDNHTEQRVTCSCKRTRVRKRGFLLCTVCDRAACSECGTSNVGTRTSCVKCKANLEGFRS